MASVTASLRRIVHVVLTTQVVMVIACCCAIASASAAQPDASDEQDCTKYKRIADGLYVQTFDATDVTGGIAGLPDRVTTDLVPGQSGRVCVGFQNRSGKPISLGFATHDVGASREGLPVPFGVGEQEHGAGSWITLPATKQVTVEHGELIWLDLAVDIPFDTTGGSAYAGVSAAVILPDEPQSAPSGPQARITPSVVVQIFFDVPGDITQKGHIQDVRSPRVVWWDGLDIGEVPGLKRLRGQGIAPVRFEWSNDGSSTDTIGGALQIESALGGKDITTIEIPERVVLRDSDRPFDVTWSKDIPFVGKFTPTLVVTRANGDVVKEELETIWVIPSWWYLLAVALAIALPLWWRRRSRHRYRDLLERVQAAEARGDGEEWDGHSGYDSDEWR